MLDAAVFSVYFGGSSVTALSEPFTGPKGLVAVETVAFVGATHCERGPQMSVCRTGPASLWQPTIHGRAPGGRGGPGGTITAIQQQDEPDKRK